MKVICSSLDYFQKMKKIAFDIEDLLEVFDQFLVENKATLSLNWSVCRYMERNHTELLLNDGIGFIRVTNH